MVSQSGHTEEHWLWHKRMSHLNFKTLNKLSKKELVVGLPKTTFRKDGICSACQMGKQSKIYFKSKTRHSSIRPLQLLHMDPFESSVTSYAGKKYGLVVIDDSKTSICNSCSGLTLECLVLDLKDILDCFPI